MQLEGVDEETLANKPVVDAWTVPSLLAHLAYWEAFAADRLAKLAGGRRGEIRPLGGDDSLEARNAAMRAQFTRLRFSEAAAACQKERRNFLSALGQLPDDALGRRVRLRPGWRVTPNKWARWPYLHDAEHAADLGRWRRTLPPNDPSLRVIHRSLLRPILGLSRSEFLALAALVPSGERETRPVEGKWSLKQVLGHLSDYERLGIVALKAIAAGREPHFGITITDFDTYNAGRGTAWAVEGWSEVWASFVATRRALLLLVESLPDDALTSPFTAPWPETTTVCGYLLDMAQHEQEHAEDLRQAFGLSNLPRRLGRVG
jgi:hypothetical protein